MDLDVVTLVDKPIDWISSLVATVKPNGKDRLRIDPKSLNKAIKRNDCPMKTIAGVLEEVQKAQCFAHFEARNGFWHVVLHEEGSVLTPLPFKLHLVSSGGKCFHLVFELVQKSSRDE